LRFSPDGQRIAVVVEEYLLPQRGVRVHLLIVPLQPSGTPIRQFEIEHGLMEMGDRGFWSSFQWTAKGDAIFVGGEIIRLTDRQPCDLTPGGKLPGSRVRIAENYFAEEGSIARAFLLDAVCNPEEHWDFRSDWIIRDVSLARHLICVSQPLHWGPQDLVEAEAARVGGRSNEVLIVEPFTGRIVQRWPPSVIPDAELRFGDSGRALCEGRGAYVPKSVPVRCWDVDSGKQISEVPAINGGLPIAVATSGSRAIGSDFRHVPIPFADEYKEVLKRRVVWDFETGKELLSWRPELQIVDVGLKGRVNRDWFAFAISADGQYIAEGGNGILRLYKIDQ
jgi:hypothetical protein